MRRAVEEGEVGVTVQLGVPAHQPHYIEHMFDSEVGNVIRP
jgi:hypothetical protein